ncbi:hypothetical protein BDZ94DRAFT_1306889 [Collybia nuda]|uniref:Uncharacterized protein n=1 Tax=Collybia nuda TaxID=64659 RepID=A0A9P5YA67_9AGAR|nr:hypothetical protein BDZ94DRAFT_1306889 [Collybia nuda]
MTMNNRATAHRMLKARQNPSADGNNLGDDPAAPDGGPDKPNEGGSKPEPTVSTPLPTPTISKPSPSPSPTTTSSTRSPTPPPPPPTTKPTTTNEPGPTSPTTTATSASQSSSASSSSSESSSSSISVSRSSSSATTSTGATLIPAANTAVVQPQGTTFVAPTISPTDNLGTTIESPTSTDLAASGGVKVGTVVGSVVGVLGALAVIGIIVAFFLRRWRRRRGGDEDFDPTQFVRSPTMLESEFRDSPTGTPYRASTFDPNPPSMAQRGHTNMASISSGAGMAGHGAYATASAIHQRPQYTYGNNEYDAGHARDDEGSDIAHGAYSSEPKPQNTYNPEAYGSYAYTTEGNHAVQQQAYHPYQAQHQQHYPEYRNTGPAPALVAGAPAVPAGRTSRQSVAINDEDVYGGI